MWKGQKYRPVRVKMTSLGPSQGRPTFLVFPSLHCALPRHRVCSLTFRYFVRPAPLISRHRYRVWAVWISRNLVSIFSSRVCHLIDLSRFTQLYDFASRPYQQKTRRNSDLQAGTRPMKRMPRIYRGRRERRRRQSSSSSRLTDRRAGLC